jgi:hypothetical protein
MDQKWFEMPDERRRKLTGAVWIPLRAMDKIEEIGQLGHLGYKSEFYGVGTLAVPVNKKPATEKLGWMDVVSVTTILDASNTRSTSLATFTKTTAESFQASI